MSTNVWPTKEGTFYVIGELNGWQIVSKPGFPTEKKIIRFSQKSQHGAREQHNKVFIVVRARYFFFINQQSTVVPLLSYAWTHQHDHAISECMHKRGACINGGCKIYENQIV